MQFFSHIYSRLLKRLKTLKPLSSRFGSLTVYRSIWVEFWWFFLLLSAVISCLTLIIYGYLALLWSRHASLWSCCILKWPQTIKVSKFVVISSFFWVISCASVQVLWVLFLTFVLTLQSTDCFTSQFGCFTHYFDYLWRLYAADCGHFAS